MCIAYTNYHNRTSCTHCHNGAGRNRNYSTRCNYRTGRNRDYRPGCSRDRLQGSCFG